LGIDVVAHDRQEGSLRILDLVDRAAHEPGTERTTDTVHQALREAMRRPAGRTT
jgi:hypothetical protein